MRERTTGRPRWTALLPLLVPWAGCSSSAPATDTSGIADARPDQRRDSLAPRELGPALDRQPPDRSTKPARWEAVVGAAPQVVAHTVTLLADGRALVVGGATSPSAVSAQAWLYDPAKNTFLAAGSLAQGRARHTATLLADGRVLVVGGKGGGSSPTLATTEIFDPLDVATPWKPGPPLPAGRQAHRALRLPAGDVLVVAGSTTTTQLATLLVLDAQAVAWKTLAAILAAKRAGHTATLLKNGKVLVVGGTYAETPNDVYLDTLELFDPVAGTVATLSAKLGEKRAHHTATLLGTGAVLVVGGEWCGQVAGQGYACENTTQDERYDPATDKVAAIGHPGTPPRHHAAAPLLDGRALITGAFAPADSSKAVVFDPSNAGAWTSAPALLTGRNDHSAATLADGSVLLVGGVGAGDVYVSTAERFYP